MAMTAISSLATQRERVSSIGASNEKLHLYGPGDHEQQPAAKEIPSGLEGLRAHARQSISMKNQKDTLARILWKKPQGGDHPPISKAEH